MRAEGEGKTVEEARIEALAKLEEMAGQLDETVEVTVLSEGSKGFLGMGSTMARVEARLPGVKAPRREEGPAAGEYEGEEEEGPEIDEEAAEARLREFLDRVLDSLGLEASVDVRHGAREIKGIVDGDDLGLFIGRHGQTMDAVQYLANIIVFKGMTERKRIIIDAEDYRDRRVEVLEALADRGANEVLKGKHEYELKPMSAAERRVVHMFLQDRDGIETFSEGKEPFRRVIITRASS